MYGSELPTEVADSDCPVPSIRSLNAAVWLDPSVRPRKLMAEPRKKTPSALTSVPAPTWPLPTQAA